MTTLDTIEKMRSLTWAAGVHPAGPTACVAEAASWATGAAWSDTPPCWPREISLLAQSIHDTADPSEYASVWTDERLLGMFAAERGVEATRRRALQAAEYARLAYVACYPGGAAGQCAPITDRATADIARIVLRTAAAATAATDAYAAADSAAYVAAYAAADAACAAHAAYAATAAADAPADSPACAADSAAHAADTAAAYAADSAAYAACHTDDNTDAIGPSARLAILDLWIGHT